MRIGLDKVVPEPLRERPLREGAVWGGTLVLEPGERVAVAAPSGSGKTTLLALLLGLRRDYQGTIRFEDAEIRGLREAGWARIRRERVAVVFQDFRLFPDLSVRDNLRIKADLTGGAEEARLVALASALDFVGLMERRCGVLSLGERQRVAIARALLQPFRWLLLDEPFSCLDPERAAAAAQLIEAECAEREAGWLLTCVRPNPALPCRRQVELS